MKLKAQIQDEVSNAMRARKIYKEKNDNEAVAYFTGVIHALRWVQYPRDDYSSLVADEELKTEARN